MKIPQAIELLQIEDEEELLDELDELSGLQLLELQKVADKITELVAIVFYAREIGATQNDDSDSEM